MSVKVIQTRALIDAGWSRQGQLGHSFDSAESAATLRLTLTRF